MTEQEGLNAFVSDIYTRAETESKAILSESDRYGREQLEELRTQLASERETVLLAARAQAQTEAGQALAEAIRSADSAVSAKQLSIREEVFEKAERRLEGFVSSEEYVPFLQKTAERMHAVLPQGAWNVSFSERDASLQSVFAAWFPSGSTFRADKSIRLGGFRAYSGDGSVCADATLDTLLAEQKRRFAENSGLDVSS